jgi:hypothetical protein
VIAYQYPVSPRPKLAPHAVTPAQAAHRQVACEDSTSALAVATGWNADNMYLQLARSSKTPQAERE